MVGQPNKTEFQKVQVRQKEIFIHSHCPVTTMAVVDTRLEGDFSRGLLTFMDKACQCPLVMVAYILPQVLGAVWQSLRNTNGREILHSHPAFRISIDNRLAELALPLGKVRQSPLAADGGGRVSTPQLLAPSELCLLRSMPY